MAQDHVREYGDERRRQERARKLRENPRVTIQEILKRETEAQGVPYDLARAILEVESNYILGSQSEKGAQGLMQLMPLMQEAYGVTDPFDPEQNIRGGVGFLKYLLEKYQGDQNLAIAAYNAGEPAVDRYGGIPPFPETQKYVEKVLSANLAETKARWIYPTEDLEIQARNAGHEEWDNPRYQGIFVSSRVPAGQEFNLTRSQRDDIFRQVDPEGFVTRETIPTLTAAVPGVASLVKGAYRLAKKPTSPTGLALTAGAGVFGAGGELIRQTQVPRQIELEGIPIVNVVRWPRTYLGMPYEGVPNSWEDSLYAAMLTGTGEAAADWGFGKILPRLAEGGSWLKTRLFGGSFQPESVVRSSQKPGLENIEGGIMGGGGEAAVPARGTDIRPPSTRGFGPNLKSAEEAASLAEGSQRISDELLEEAGDVFVNPQGWAQAAESAAEPRAGSFAAKRTYGLGSETLSEVQGAGKKLVAGATPPPKEVPDVVVEATPGTPKMFTATGVSEVIEEIPATPGTPRRVIQQPDVPLPPNPISIKTANTIVRNITDEIRDVFHPSFGGVRPVKAHTDALSALAQQGRDLIEAEIRKTNPVLANRWRRQMLRTQELREIERFSRNAAMAGPGGLEVGVGASAGAQVLDPTGVAGVGSKSLAMLAALSKGARSGVGQALYKTGAFAPAPAALFRAGRAAATPSTAPESPEGTRTRPRLPIVEQNYPQWFNPQLQRPIFPPNPMQSMIRRMDLFADPEGLTRRQKPLTGTPLTGATGALLRPFKFTEEQLSKLLSGWKIPS